MIISIFAQVRNSDSDSSQVRSSTSSPKTLVILAIVATILFWASAFPAISLALKVYTPTEVALLRYLVASVVLLAYAVVKRMPLPRSRDLPAIALSGLIGFTLILEIHRENALGDRISSYLIRKTFSETAQSETIYL